MNKRNFLFIVNPNSGVGKFNKLEKAIDKNSIGTLITYKIIYTEYAGHAKEIAKRESNNFDVIVAVGGDGSVNEVGQGLIGGKAAMGIIPVGSGNGLARSLEIPLSVAKALSILVHSSEKTIDVISINDEHFFNVGGIGFDAFIGHLFDNSKKRGLLSYIKIVLKAYFNYKPQTYSLSIDGQEREFNAFLISFANSNQWGNNFYISPLSRIADGELEICVIKPFSLFYAPLLAFAMFSKTIHKISKVNIYSAKSVVVGNDKELEYHIDGEPRIASGDIKIEVIPNSLKVITPL